MPRAIPLARREQIVAQHQEGQSLAAIAHQWGMPYRSVREIWRRFRQQGRAGLAIHYGNCGRRGTRSDPRLVAAALSMKQAHPSWGAGLIRLQLAQQFAGEPLPAVRTLQRWWQQAGLQPPRAKKPPVRQARARTVHEVWEVDAKERLRLADASPTCVLTVADEASGALLGIVPFPPVSLDASERSRRTRGHALPLRAVGPAGADPRG